MNPRNSRTGSTSRAHLEPDHMKVQQHQKPVRTFKHAFMCRIITGTFTSIQLQIFPPVSKQPDQLLRSSLLSLVLTSAPPNPEPPAFPLKLPDRICSAVSGTSWTEPRSGSDGSSHRQSRGQEKHLDVELQAGQMKDGGDLHLHRSQQELQEAGGSGRYTASTCS